MMLTTLLLSTLMLRQDAVSAATDSSTDSAVMTEVDLSTIYDFKVQSIDEQEVKLSKYKGRVIMVVNTASKCGLTPQYAGLQNLYKKYKNKGFVVIGFPANNFRDQEPGTNAEIKEFCTREYKVEFPMMAKISVKGQDMHPLYKWLISKSSRPEDDIEWNFAKFLIGRDGKVAKRFPPKETPESKWLIEAIEAEIAKPAPK